MLHYEELINCAPFGYMTLDERGRIFQINQTGARLLGHDREKLEGTTLTSFLRKRSDVEELLHHLKRCKQGESRVCSEFSLVSADGRSLPIRIFSQPRFQDGEMTCFSTLTDLSEQQEAEAALRASEQRLEQLNQELERRVELRTTALRNSQMLKNAVLDAINTQIVVVDSHGLIVESNASWRDACDAGQSACIDGVGRFPNYLECCERLIKEGDESAAEVFEVITAVVRGDRPRGTVDFHRIDQRGNERWISLKVTPLPEGSGAVLFHEEQTKQRQLEREILEISERQKRRIGQDLHDGVCPHLSGSAMIAKSLAGRVARVQPDEGKELDEITTLVQDGIDQVRAIARGLHPVELDSGGLEGALSELAKSSSRRIPTAFQCRGQIADMSEEIATNLYRIAQEGVNNAIRHAGASRITIFLRQTDTHLILAVEDDGKGIPIVHEPSKGMGLNIMHYRASSIGARFDMGNTPKGGAWLRCLVPLSNLGH